MLTLDWKGVLGALFIVVLIIGITGDWRYIAVMVVFLLAAAYVTTIGIAYKKTHGFFEFKRGIKNVISNGLVPVIFAILNMPGPFLGAMAAVTADKFASELGIFDKEVWDVVKRKKVDPGRDGGVSKYGLLASLVGAAIIALVGGFLFELPLEKTLIITLAGFLGSLADSVAGHFEAQGIGTKETSNIIGSLVGALIGFLV
ncbi:MAG: DUF92 domain-containing protein [Candidatus Micrarchaeota archaeon]|nr:DUF92 domain-containing protein [Candidatus Micrarchaeota archaeon]